MIVGMNTGWWCRCSTSWWDLDLTIGLALVTLTLNACLHFISENVKYKKMIHGKDIGQKV